MAAFCTGHFIFQSTTGLSFSFFVLCGPPPKFGGVQGKPQGSPKGRHSEVQILKEDAPIVSPLLGGGAAAGPGGDFIYTKKAPRVGGGAGSSGAKPWVLLANLACRLPMLVRFSAGCLRTKEPWKKPVPLTQDLLKWGMSEFVGSPIMELQFQSGV